MAELLQLRGVSKRYRRGEGSVQVLADVSLEVAAGEIVAVVGAPGAGKSTLLSIAAGVVRPDAGEVRCDGGVLGALPRRRRERLLGNKIALTDRKPPLLPWKICDFVGLPHTTGRGRRRSRQARDVGGEALRRVGFQGGIDRRWEELSDWERVLVGFARVAVCAPRLALVDGLLDGLDRHRTQHASELLRDLVEELGCGVLMSATELQGALVANQVWQLQRAGRLTMAAGRTGQEEGTVIEFPAGAADGRGARGAGM